MSHVMPPELLESYRARIEQALDTCLPPTKTPPTRLHEAMRYAVLGGGKRIRPVLVYATGEAVGVALDTLDAAACAVELIHAYSLIHDDLPAMDNDDLRRGRPTCHKAFDEATAILAGDALQPLAFQILAQKTSVSETIRLRWIDRLAQAAGSRGMAGGQMMDMQAVGCELSLAELENMHIHKTGALIRASVLMGAVAQPDLAIQQFECLEHYANCIGLAFQIRDDILDVTGDTHTLGKSAGADASLQKPTYPSLLGLAGARGHAESLCNDALTALEAFGTSAEALRYIARYIVARVH